MLSGEYKVVLDDKGRISLPANLRKGLTDASLFLTKGEDNCLWLYTSEKWQKLVGDTIKEVTNPFSGKDRRVLRKLVGPAQEIEVDKAGRIPIAQSLREFAGLSKGCVVLGQIDYIEIWDEGRYSEYFDGKDEEFKAASEEISNKINSKRGISN